MIDNDDLRIGDFVFVTLDIRHLGNDASIKRWTYGQFMIERVISGPNTWLWFTAYYGHTGERTRSNTMHNSPLTAFNDLLTVMLSPSLVESLEWVQS